MRGGELATDSLLLSNINQSHPTGAKNSNPFFTKPRFGGNAFVIKHFAGDVLYSIDGFIKKNNDSLSDDLKGKYSKRRRSNVAVIIVGKFFISSFLFYCLLLNHSFPTNPNSITNCFKLFSLYCNFTTTFAQCVRLF